jgi:hypothetical protein
MGISSFPGLVTQNGGQVLSPNYCGMWGNKVRFVDYDNGTTGSVGETPDAAAKNLQTVIDSCSEWDTIYIRPRDPDSAGGDPQAILPASTTNWSITYGKHGLSLIGTGLGVGMRQANMTRLQASTTVQATATMTCYAPYVNFENLTFRRGGGTLAGLKIEGQTSGGSGYAFNTVVNNCGFWKIGATATQGALYYESAWHCLTANSWFEECAKGIGHGVSGSSIVGINVIGCTFSGVDTTIDTDIYATGGSTISAVLIDRCLFAHDIPALASGNLYNKYIDFATASGLISNSCFGSETETIATNMDRSNCDVVNCWFTNTTNLFPNND